MIISAALTVILGLACVPARAETVSLEIGPVRLRGLHDPQVGPSQESALRFNHPGWIRGFSVQVLDAKRRSANDKGILCHASVKKLKAPPKIGGIFSEPLHLTAAEGQTDFRFPEGYGLRIDSTTSYALEAVLQSADSANDGKYSFLYRFDTAWDSADSTLKTLSGFAVGKELSWHVPPGRHQYQSEFTMAFSGGIHFLAFHLHQYVTEVSIVDADTGLALYRAPVKNRANGWPEDIPFYSDAKGIALVKGRRYFYRTVYDNPLNIALPTMSIARLYVHPDGV